MYNIKVHYVQVSEPCSVYLPRKIEICRSYMRSNRLYSNLIAIINYMYTQYVSSVDKSITLYGLCAKQTISGHFYVIKCHRQ